MRKVLLIIFILINTILYGQQKIFPEQIAFDYLKRNLLNEHFESNIKFLLHNEIKECNARCFPKCENDSLSENYWYVTTNDIYPAPTDSFINAQKQYIFSRDSVDFDFAKNDQFAEKINFSNRKKVREVYIYENFSAIPNLYLVRISVESAAVETNFYIEVDKNGNVTRWCNGSRM